MKLPLVEEVRSAEETVLEAQRAFHDAGRVDAALRSVQMLQERRDAPPFPVGRDEIVEVAAAWPALAHLGVGLGPGLDDRRARLEALLAWLKPLAERAPAAFAALDELRQRQQRDWSAPRYRRSVDAINKRVEARMRLEHELQPLESELVMVGLLETVLATWAERLAATTDDRLREAILSQLTASVTPMLNDLDPSVRAGFGPDASPAEFRALAARARERRATLEDRAAPLRRSRDQLVAWLSARLS